MDYEIEKELIKNKVITNNIDCMWFDINDPYKKSIHFRASIFHDVVKFIRLFSGAKVSQITNFLANKNSETTWQVNTQGNSFSTIYINYIDQINTKIPIFGERITFGNNIGNVALNNWNVFIHEQFPVEVVAKMFRTDTTTIRKWAEPDSFEYIKGKEYFLYSSTTVDNLVNNDSFIDTMKERESKRKQSEKRNSYIVPLLDKNHQFLF
jgi:hypothetical protein